MAVRKQIRKYMKTITEAEVKDIIDILINSLQKAKDKSITIKSAIPIDCVTLEETSKKLRECKFYPTLSEYKAKPVLYWIEKTSETPNEKICDDATECDKRRKITAINKDNIDTTCLYVGKVKKGFCERIKTHHGYDESGSVYGLQLCHWATKIELALKLEVHYIVFDENMADLMSALEASLARDLKPLLGTRHG